MGFLGKEYHLIGSRSAAAFCYLLAAICAVPGTVALRQLELAPFFFFCAGAALMIGIAQAPERLLEKVTGNNRTLSVSRAEKSFYRLCLIFLACAIVAKLVEGRFGAVF